MADTIIYEFTAHDVGEEWTTAPGEMVDGVTTDYASTSDDGDIEKLIDSECVGEDLGAISKVELRAYAYSDVNDQLILRPVFGGTDDGDNHTTVPGVAPGSWGDWQDVTVDPNSPAVDQGHEGTAAHTTDIYEDHYKAQAFTTGSAYTVKWAQVEISKDGSPANLEVAIQGVDGSNHPDNSDLCSGTILASDVGASAAWITVDFGAGASLSDATMYALVLRQAGDGGSNGNDYDWSLNNEGYADGAAEETTDGGSNWATISPSFDWHFYVGPGFSWSDVQNLDCDVEQNDVSKGNTMYCGMVQIQVTYTAEAPPEGVAVQMMHYARMRRR